MSREKLGSRLGFILLSAGCAIGCGNVWKFPWMTGQNGGASFILIYLICLVVLGLPVMIMEFAVGRASQTSPLYMYKKLEGPKQKWGFMGYVCLVGNIALMSFYTVVCGWIINYFVKFLTGNFENIGFVPMITDAKINVIYLVVTVVVAFAILCFNIQKGLEKITKYMMLALFVLMIVMVVNSMTLSGASEGLKFYLVPDFSKITFSTVVAAMNQAFFTLSLGMGSMAIFGSYIGKERSLMGESINIIVLDTLVAILAGLIIFPACTTYGVDVGAGPGLLFDTMATVFTSMAGGRIWGTLFFLFMVFAAMSTVLAVCENIIAMVRDLTGWSRPKASIISGVGVTILAMTTALGYSVLGNVHPMGGETAFLDLWDFIVSNNILPIGSIAFCIFCTTKLGWGWNNFLAEANTGKGLKVAKWLRPLFMVIVPVIVAVVYIFGIIDFFK